MSRFRNSWILSAGIMSVLTACHSNQTDSSFKDLATEAMPESTSSTRLIWQVSGEPDSFVFAKCPANLLPVRKNCKEFKQFKKDEILNVLKSHEAMQLSSLNQEYLTTLNTVLLQHPRFAGKIKESQRIQADIEKRQKEIEDLQKEIERLKESKINLEKSLDDRFEQIATVENLIKQFPNRPEFVNQKRDLEIEVASLQISLDENTSAISRTQSEVVAKEQGIEGLSKQIVEIDESLATFASTTQYTHPDLEAIKGKMAAVKRIGESNDKLLQLISETPGFSFRLFDLQGDLLPIGQVLFSAPKLWSSKQFIDFDSVDALESVPSPWLLQNEEGKSYLATNMGNYGTSLNQIVELKPLDVDTSEALKLTLKHRFETENGFDYGVVEYLDVAGNWQLASPRFEGRSFEWTESSFELPALSGLQQLRLRLRFVADSMISYRGWHIDSLSVGSMDGE